VFINHFNLCTYRLMCSAGGTHARRKHKELRTRVPSLDGVVAGAGAGAGGVPSKKLAKNPSVESRVLAAAWGGHQREATHSIHTEQNKR
jgi:hypothetical protein